MSKILMINGSPHQAGSTQRCLEEMAAIFGDAQVEFEIFQLGSGPYESCRACGYCKTHARCIVDDLVNQLAERAAEADGFVFGSPVHYAGISGAIVSVLGRLFYSHAKLLQFKPAAAFVVCRRGGATAALDQLNKFITINNMPLISSQYWNIVHGASPADVEQDREGLQTLRQLARNLVWVMDSLREYGRLPETEVLQRTNFIR
jgi:multimeric flavodoxin WrbA